MNAADGIERVARGLPGLLLFLGSVFAGIGSDPVGSANGPESPDRNMFRAGRHVYQRQCLVCHGRFGEGDGEWVQGWAVKPWDFTKGRFKYRSTPYGMLPTNADLERTIRNGVSGTAMPAFKELPSRDLRAVIEYIKFFSKLWNDKDYFEEPIVTSQPPGWFLADKQRSAAIRSGAETFRQTCSTCHGERGAGDGAASSGLNDSDGHPIRPADLRGPLRSGKLPEDVFRTIMTGVSGTPMMGFAGVFETDEVWELVAYIRALAHEGDELDEAKMQQEDRDRGQHAKTGRMFQFE